MLGVSAKPIHLLDPGDIKPPKIDELFLDIGLSGEEVGQSRSGRQVTMDRTVDTYRRQHHR